MIPAKYNIHLEQNFNMWEHVVFMTPAPDFIIFKIARENWIFWNLCGLGTFGGGQIAIVGQLAKTVLTLPAKILPPENHILDSWLASSLATEGGVEKERVTLVFCETRMF